MRPKGNAAVYRPDLGQVVMEYAEGATMGFIGPLVMPLFPVAEKSSTYPVIPKEALLSVPDTSRAPRGKYNRGDWEYERGKYDTSEHGWEEPVDDSERAMVEQEAPGLADEIAVERSWGHIMRGQEKRIAGKVMNPTNFTAHAVGVAWDNAATTTPIDDVKDAKGSVRRACGMLPNTLIISYTTFENLKTCDQIVDRLKYTFPGLDINRMSSQQLAAVLDVPQVLVGGGVYNAAGKGLDANIADMWGDEYAMLTIVGQGRDITAPCIGRTFLWTADSPENPIVEVYREDKIRSDIYRVRHHVSEEFIQSKDDNNAVVSNIASAVSYLMSNIHT